MALTIAKLADELAAMPLTTDAVEAAANLTQAWHNFFLDATVNLVPAVPAALEIPVTGAKALMLAAVAPMTPLSFEQGIQAYWGGVAVAAAAIWPLPTPLASATPPPTLIPGAVTAALTPVFAANVAGALSTEASCLAIATALYPVAALGGLGVVATPPPPSYPIL